MKNRRSVSESRPIYGTARLGLQNYGYPIVKPVVERVALLEQIFDLGVDIFDTSPRYGDAESLLGDVIKRSGKPISVNTKVDGLNPNDPNSKNIVYESVMRSIEILGVDQLDTLYLHQNSLDIIADKYVHEGLNRIFEEKLTRHVGASLYFQDEISYALESSLFGTIQIASNNIPAQTTLG